MKSWPNPLIGLLLSGSGHPIRSAEQLSMCLAVRNTSTKSVRECWRNRPARIRLLEFASYPDVFRSQSELQNLLLFRWRNEGGINERLSIESAPVADHPRITGLPQRIHQPIREFPQNL